MHILPLNAEQVFIGIRIRLHDGRAFVGCRDDSVAQTAADPDHHRIFVPGQVLAMIFPKSAVAEVTTFNLPVAPESTYTVTHQKTGGISSSGTDNDAFHRRHVIAAEPTKKRSPLVLMNPDPDILDTFLRKYPDVQRLRYDVQEDRAGEEPSDERSLHEYESESAECEQGEQNVDEEGNVYVTITAPGDMIQHTIFAAEWHGLLCVSLARRLPSILCDTLFRQRHTYAQQTRAVPMDKVGPTRDPWRFCMQHIPPEWLEDRLAPFTWEAYGRNVFRTTPKDRLCELPEPLKTFALREGLNAVNEVLREHPKKCIALATAKEDVRVQCEALRHEGSVVSSKLRAMQQCTFSDLSRSSIEYAILSDELDDIHAELSERIVRHSDASDACDRHEWAVRESVLALRHVNAMQPDPKINVCLRCPALTEAQQEQGIHLFHCLKFGFEFLSADEVAGSRAALFQFAVRNGTVVHLVTVYEQTGNFKGFGDKLRGTPAEHLQLPSAVRNRCRMENGQLVGVGGQGCKGIVYAPKAGEKVYVPLKRHPRSVEDTAHMLAKHMRTDEVVA